MDKLDDVIYIAKQFKRQAETAVMRDLYFTENPSNIIGFCDAVLDLLKEKQPKKPIYDCPLIRCPKCKNSIDMKQKYCDECGQAIDWKDGEQDGKI